MPENTDQVSQLPQTSEPEPDLENQSSIQLPRTSSDSSSQIITAFIVIFIIYWIGYLVVNYNDRMYQGIGLSNFPLPLTIGQILQFIIAFAISLFIYLLYKSLKRNLKFTLTKFVLLIPAGFIIFSAVLIVIGPSLSSCEGLGCLGFAIIATWIFIMAASVYVVLLITSFIIKLVQKNKVAFKLLLGVFVLSIVVPFLLPMFITKSQGYSSIIDENVEITKTSFKKEKINKKTFDEIQKLDPCCEINKDATGFITLANLGNNKYLLQGKIKREDGGYQGNISRADLYVRNGNTLVNVTKGADFRALSDGFGSSGSGTRPAILSPTKDKIAFFESFVSAPELFVVNLNGTGVLVDEAFCPWDCRIYWGADDYIYTHVKFRYEEEYWRVTLP